MTQTLAERERALVREAWRCGYASVEHTDQATAGDVAVSEVIDAVNATHPPQPASATVREWADRFGEEYDAARKLSPIGSVSVVTAFALHRAGPPPAPDAGVSQSTHELAVLRDLLHVAKGCGNSPCILHIGKYTGQHTSGGCNCKQNIADAVAAVKKVTDGI